MKFYRSTNIGGQDISKQLYTPVPENCRTKFRATSQRARNSEYGGKKETKGKVCLEEENRFARYKYGILKDGVPCFLSQRSNAKICGMGEGIFLH